MKCLVHLISMPWAPANSPSLQLGCLSSYLSENLKNKNVAIKTYSAFYTIPAMILNTPELKTFSDKIVVHRENIYYYIYCKHFKPSLYSAGQILKANRAVRKINKEHFIELDNNLLDEFASNTIKYVKRQIVPHLSATRLNIVGFSVQFWQAYSSLFCARYLQDHYAKKYKMLFVFGGSVVSEAKFAMIARSCGINGIALVGEGEKSFCNLVDDLAGGHSHMPERLAENRKNIYCFSNFEKFFAEPYCTGKNPEIRDLNKLPYPDYNEYFQEVGSCCRSVGYDYGTAINEQVYLPLEGSRGCSHNKCGFCNYNSQWASKYRSKTPLRVLQETVALKKRYKASAVVYADNDASSWLDEFSSTMIRSRLRPDNLMQVELRANDDEGFWVRIYLAGFTRVFVGTETLSERLMGLINKNMFVMSAIMSQKFVLELGLEFYSNLIMYHPRSIAQDVHETIRILKFIPHFNEFITNYYLCLTNSRDYLRLSHEEQQVHERNIAAYYMFEMDKKIPENSLSGYIKENVPKHVKVAWKRFEIWHDSFKRNQQGCQLDVFRLDRDTLHIADSRFQKTQHIFLTGKDVVIYDLCHSAPTFEQLQKVSGLPNAKIANIINGLIDKKLILKLSERYLALALRSKNELILNHTNKQ